MYLLKPFFCSVLSIQKHFGKIKVCWLVGWLVVLVALHCLLYYMMIIIIIFYLFFFYLFLSCLIFTFSPSDALLNLLVASVSCLLSRCPVVLGAANESRCSVHRETNTQRDTRMLLVYVQRRWRLL